MLRTIFFIFILIAFAEGSFTFTPENWCIKMNERDKAGELVRSKF